MTAYNRDRAGEQGRGGRKFGGAGRGFGKPSFGRRDRDEHRPQMHKAICDECGDQCEVPFRPSGEKPVFCRDCFDNVGGGNDRPQRNDSFRDRGNRDDRGGRDFNREKPRMDAPRDNSKEQFEMLNAKLDKILKLITPVISVSKEKQAEVAAKMEKAESKKAETKKIEANAEEAAPIKAPKAKKAVKKSK